MQKIGEGVKSPLIPWIRPCIAAIIFVALYMYSIDRNGFITKAISAFKML